MLVSTRGRYALRILLELGKYDAARYVPLPLIAQRQDISEKYLESIVSTLVKAGLLDGMRGKNGGYRLNRPLEGYSVGEVLRLTEGSLAPVSCLVPGAAACPRMSGCRTYEMWKGLDELISDYFGKITLADLVLPDQPGNDYII